MKTKAPIALAALLAAGALTYSQPASAHPMAKCEAEAYDSCMETDLPKSWCFAVAEQQCAGHSHGSGSVNPASADYIFGTDLIIIDTRKTKLQRN